MLIYRFSKRSQCTVYCTVYYSTYVQCTVLYGRILGYSFGAVCAATSLNQTNKQQVGRKYATNRLCKVICRRGQSYFYFRSMKFIDANNNQTTEKEGVYYPLTKQPGLSTSLLYSGSKFVGSQKSKGNSYDVEIILQVWEVKY